MIMMLKIWSKVNFIVVKMGIMNLGTYIVEVLRKDVTVMTKHNCSVLIALYKVLKYKGKRLLGMLSSLYLTKSMKTCTHLSGYY